MATIWIEKNVSAGRVTTVDHYPLWTAKGDTWEWIGDPVGVGSVDKTNSIMNFRFRFNNLADYIKFYCTASDANVMFRVYLNGGLVGEADKTVTTEENIDLQVDIKGKGFSSGEGEISVKASGNYTIKGDTMKCMAFYVAGFTEATPPDTTFTEVGVS